MAAQSQTDQVFIDAGISFAVCLERCWYMVVATSDGSPDNERRGREHYEQRPQVARQGAEGATVPRTTRRRVETGIGKKIGKRERRPKWALRF